MHCAVVRTVRVCALWAQQADNIFVDHNVGVDLVPASVGFFSDVKASRSCVIEHALCPKLLVSVEDAVLVTEQPGDTIRVVLSYDGQVHSQGVHHARSEVADRVRRRTSCRRNKLHGVRAWARRVGAVLCRTVRVGVCERERDVGRSSDKSMNSPRTTRSRRRGARRHRRSAGDGTGLAVGDRDVRERCGRRRGEWKLRAPARSRSTWTLAE